MKHSKTLIVTLSLVLLTLLTIISSVLCHLFMPIAFEDPRDDNITDYIVKNRMSRWEFYKKLNESDQSEFRASIRIAVPDEAFEQFNGESYKNDYNKAKLFFENYAQDFLEEHQLANYATKIWSDNWMRSTQGNTYNLHTEFDIRIYADQVTPRTYLQEKEKILALIEEGIILSASFDVGDPQIISTAVDNTTYSTNTETFSLSDAFAQIKLTGNVSSNIDGYGIKVGIIEKSTDTAHRHNVNGIIKTIAPQAETYITTITAEENFIDAIKNYADPNSSMHCDIINISLAVNTFNPYAKTDYNLILDYWSNVGNCLIIVSAGNGNPTGVYIPADSPNVLTVGATNKNMQLCDFSLYTENGVSSPKPELVAPGQNLVGLRNFENSTENLLSPNELATFTGISGTSYSAPIVTGLAVLLLDEFPNLKNNPEAVKAILMESCSKLSNHTANFDLQSGAGLVDYVKAKTIASNNRFVTTSFNEEEPFGPIITHFISIPKNTTARITLTQFEPGVGLNDIGRASGFNMVVNSYTIFIIDCLTSTQVHSAICDKNTGYITYKNNTSSDRNYKIIVSINEITDDEQNPFSLIRRVNREADTSCGDIINENPTCEVAIAYNVPNSNCHIYPGAWTINATSHSKTCMKCGYCDTSTHSFPAAWSQTSVTHYKNCTVCGYSQSASHTISLGKCIVCGYRSSTIVEPWNKPDQPELN